MPKTMTEGARRFDPRPGYRSRKGPTMRRLLYSLAAVAGLLCGLAGCNHTAGVCDCDIDEDPCAARAPWYKAPPAPNSEALQKLPAKL